MPNARGPALTAAECALLRNGLRAGWGSWVGAERHVSALQTCIPERVHGRVEDILASLRSKGMVRQAGDPECYALTPAGLDAAKVAKAESVELLQSKQGAGHAELAWFPHLDRLRNPKKTLWNAEPDFQQFMRKDCAHNAALLGEILTRMAAVLEDPDSYGDFYAVPSVRKCRVAYNMRLRWRSEKVGGPLRVTFIDVSSREDKGYSPRQR